MRYWSVYFVFLFSKRLLLSLFSVWGRGWMCVPSGRRVPAGRGAPAQAGGHPQGGVSPSALF